MQIPPTMPSVPGDPVVIALPSPPLIQPGTFLEIVGSGFEAIQAYHRHRPDVVLMDYYMPHLNGATACRNILSRYPAANVILVSGVVGAEVIGQRGVVFQPMGDFDEVTVIDEVCPVEERE